jgi:hypothetical protein
VNCATREQALKSGPEDIGTILLGGDYAAIKAILKAYIQVPNGKAESLALVGVHYPSQVCPCRDRGH